MKRLYFSCILICLSFTTSSQDVKIDSVNYRAYIKNVYNSESVLIDSQRSNTLFEFRGESIKTNLYGQHRNFRIIGDWESDKLSSGHNVKIAQARDKGGFNLAITVGYEESNDDYFAILAYNNVSQIFRFEEEEIPDAYDEHFLYPGDPNLSIHDDLDVPDYTHEEIMEILDEFGNPTVIMTGVIFNIPILIPAAIIFRHLPDVISNSSLGE